METKFARLKDDVRVLNEIKILRGSLVVCLQRHEKLAQQRTKDGRFPLGMIPSGEYYWNVEYRLSDGQGGLAFRLRIDESRLDFNIGDDDGVFPKPSEKSELYDGLDFGFDAEKGAKAE